MATNKNKQNIFQLITNNIQPKPKSITKKIDPKSISILKVTVSDWEGKTKGYPYRILSIPSSYCLDDLASLILESFDFDKDHLYGFYDNLKNWTKSNETYILDADFGDDATGFTHVVKVGQVFNKPKKKMLFLFDYGDEWRFIVESIKEKFAENKIELIENILESKGESPMQYPDFEDEDVDDLEDEIEEEEEEEVKKKPRKKK